MNTLMEGGPLNAVTPLVVGKGRNLMFRKNLEYIEKF